MSNRIVHFEIQSADPERAAKFYSDVFGWSINEWKFPGVEMRDENRYWLVMTDSTSSPQTTEEGSKEAGINGGLLFRKGPAPTEGQGVNAYVCVIDVSAVDEYAEKITKAGGKIVVPKMAIAGVGWVVYAKDLDGNIFGIMQADENAK